jgi:type I restriction enzyme, S subunit
MSKEDKNKVVPRLRFPEFKDVGEWNIEPFNEIYSFKPTNSFTRNDLNYKSGFAKNIHYGDIHTKFSAHFDIRKELVPYVNSEIPIDKFNSDGFCKEGDVIFADASEDLDDIGKSIEIVQLNNEKVLSGLHTLLARQKDSKLNVGFGGHLFMSYGVRSQIQREAQGSKVLGISATRLSNVKVYYPQVIPEQQKIASCLSSLDDLITAHSQKLEVLKAHKKGLMQQLFPAEGETLPKLRFEEFMESGEWEGSLLKDVFSIFQGFAFSSDDCVSEGARWLKIADVSIQQMNHDSPSFLPIDFKVKYRKFIIKKGDYVIALTRPILSKELKLAQVDDVFHESLLNQRVGKLVTSKNIAFVYYLLQTSKLIKDIEKSIAGSEPPNLSTQQIENIETHIPKDKDEQRKIASCLSSLDELIGAQSQKIEALKAHKKGLMQGLFPSINKMDK